MKTILLTYSNDSNKHLPELSEEITTIQESLIPLINDGIATPQSHNLEDPSKIAKWIDKYKENLTILLFSGHASQSGISAANGDEAYAEGFSKLLKKSECPNLKLVFLNGCSTIGMASMLLENDVPIVICTYKEVGDQNAANFSKFFFQKLAEGRTIKDAYNIATATILSGGKKNIIYRGIIQRPEDDLKDLKISKDDWYCFGKDDFIYTHWTINGISDEESIKSRDFGNIVQTSENRPGYKKLKALREVLIELEHIKDEMDNDDEKFDIESLCLHIENEINNTSTSHWDIGSIPLRTTNNKVKYIISNAIGFGRHSDIFRAQRVEGNIEQEVAFKVLRFNSLDGLNKLKNKIYDLKSLSKNMPSSIVKTISGSFETDFRYYVSEYVDIPNLSEYIKVHKTLSGKDLLKTIQKILDPICEALEYLHEKEAIAHLDVRPSNIVIKTTNGDEIIGVVLIDFDDHVSKDRKYNAKHKKYIKSSPYLDPQIKEDAANGDFKIENCYQADIYSLTMVFLFCLVKEDLMDQSLFKKIHDTGGLEKLINKLEVRNKIKTFLKKGTRINNENFNGIKHFREELKALKHIKLPWYSRISKEVILGTVIILAVGLFILLFYTYFFTMPAMNEVRRNLEKEKTKAESLNTQLFQLQDWHLQIPLNTTNGQIPYVYNETNPFFENIKKIVSEITAQDSINLNILDKPEPLDTTSVVTDITFKNLLKDTIDPTKSFNGSIKGDQGTHYFPISTRVSITDSATTTNVNDFNPSAIRIINRLSKYLLAKTKIRHGQKQNPELLNSYLIGGLQEKDSIHIITLLYLGYLEEGKTNGQKTSFMLRYPAYDVKRKFKNGIEILYPLTKRPWWEAASPPKKEYGLTEPYVDSRNTMPQPRTFWYRIHLNHPKATAILGVDFVFRPIENDIKKH